MYPQSGDTSLPEHMLASPSLCLLGWSSCTLGEHLACEIIAQPWWDVAEEGDGLQPFSIKHPASSLVASRLLLQLLVSPHSSLHLCRGFLLLFRSRVLQSLRGMGREADWEL